MLVLHTSHASLRIESAKLKNDRRMFGKSAKSRQRSLSAVISVLCRHNQISQSGVHVLSYYCNRARASVVPLDAVVIFQGLDLSNLYPGDCNWTFAGMELGRTDKLRWSFVDAYDSYPTSFF
jgi:hypothetical protein